VLLSLRTNQTRQGAEEEKAFVPCSPHRIPSGTEKTSDTWDIAVSAKQRNRRLANQEFPIDVKVSETPGGRLMRF
jgi:hypothetical protein